VARSGLLLLAAPLIGVLILLLVVAGRRAGGPSQAQGPPVPLGGAEALAVPAARGPYLISPLLPHEPALGMVSLRKASTEYFVNGPGDSVVELRLIVDNQDPWGRNTDSTTILWEPSFARITTLLASDPPAWRTRIDERGWGVMDTAGVLGRRYGTFRLWFAVGDYAVQEPQVTLVANGHIVLAETVATATHRRRGASTPAQTAFERGPLARAADLSLLLPGDERGAFPLAAGVGLLLTAVATAGGLAAFLLANGQRKAPSFDGKGRVAERSSRIARLRRDLGGLVLHQLLGPVDRPPHRRAAERHPLAVDPHREGLLPGDGGVGPKLPAVR
jgi:hypothetical protein